NRSGKFDGVVLGLVDGVIQRCRHFGALRSQGASRRGQRLSCLADSTAFASSQTFRIGILASLGNQLGDQFLGYGGLGRSSDGLLPHIQIKGETSGLCHYATI